MLKVFYNFNHILLNSFKHKSQKLFSTRIISLTRLQAIFIFFHPPPLNFICSGLIRYATLIDRLPIVWLMLKTCRKSLNSKKCSPQICCVLHPIPIVCITLFYYSLWHTHTHVGLTFKITVTILNSSSYMGDYLLSIFIQFWELRLTKKVKIVWK